VKRALAVLGAALALGGCASMQPKVDIADTQPVRPVVQAAPAVNNGAIFQGTSYRPLFEDHRARLVGDTITVQIVEKVAASQQSTSTVDKSGSVEAGITALPFFPSSAFNRASASGSSNNSFEGKGTTASANTFTGTITATVTEVLPNGHLVVAGEKQIGVNAHVDVLRFTGQVDPRAIQPGNSVASAQIANVRIEQRGRGAQAEAQVIGWLARFFLSVLPI
jgi:flagellar L-ring protein precursor FlgH